MRSAIAKSPDYKNVLPLLLHTDINIREYSSNVVWNLCECKETVRADIMLSGVLQPIVTLLESDSPSCRTNAAGAVYRLCENSAERRLLFHPTPTLSLLVRLIADPKGDATLMQCVENASGAIYHLCSDNKAEIQSSVVHDEMFDHCLAVIPVCTASAKLFLISTLGSIIKSGPQHRGAFVAAGLINCIVKEYEKANEETKTAILTCIVALAEDEQHALSVNEAGAIATLAKILPEQNNASNTPVHRTAALRALFYLSLHPETYPQLKECKVGESAAHLRFLSGDSREHALGLQLMLGTVTPAASKPGAPPPAKKILVSSHSTSSADAKSLQKVLVTRGYNAVVVDQKDASSIFSALTNSVVIVFVVDGETVKSTASRMELHASFDMGIEILLVRTAADLSLPGLNLCDPIDCAHSALGWLGSLVTSTNLITLTTVENSDPGIDVIVKRIGTRGQQGVGDDGEVTSPLRGAAAQPRRTGSHREPEPKPNGGCCTIL